MNEEEKKKIASFWGRGEAGWVSRKMDKKLFEISGLKNCFNFSFFFSISLETYFYEQFPIISETFGSDFFFRFFAYFRKV